MNAPTAARCCALALVALTAACSARGSSGSMAGFSRDVGTGSQLDVEQEVEETIIKYQFQINQRIETPPLLWETRWRPRAPFPDEEALGVAEAQVRLFVRARPRGSQVGLGQLFVVSLTVENRVQMMGSQEWDGSVATDSYQEWASEIAEDLRQRLDVGIRVFQPPPCCN